MSEDEFGSSTAYLQHCFLEEVGQERSNNEERLSDGCEIKSIAHKDGENQLAPLVVTQKRRVDILRERALLKKLSKPKLDDSANVIDLTSFITVTEETTSTKVGKILKRSDPTPKSQPRKNWASMKIEFSKKLAEDRSRGLIERRKQFNEDNELWDDEEEGDGLVEGKSEEEELDKDYDGGEEEDELDEEAGDETDSVGNSLDEDIEGDNNEDDDAGTNTEIGMDPDNDNFLVDGNGSEGKTGESHSIRQASPDFSARSDVKKLQVYTDHSSMSNDYCNSLDDFHQSSYFYDDDDMSQEFNNVVVSEKLVGDIVFGNLLTTLSDAEIFEIETELLGLKDEGPSVYESIMEELEKEDAPKKTRKRKLEFDSDEDEEREAKKLNIEDDLFQIDDNGELLNETISDDIQNTRVLLVEGDIQAKTAVDNLRWETESDTFDNDSRIDDPAKKTNWLEDEAELSGSDVGSDVDDEDNIDEYLVEEGDNDQIDIDEVRGQNMKTYMKLRRDEDDRFVEHLQEEFEANQAKKWDRSFRQRLKDYSEIDMDNLFKGNEPQDENDGDDPIVSVKALDTVIKKVRDGVGEAFESSGTLELVHGKGDKASTSLQTRNSMVNRQ